MIYKIKKVFFSRTPIWKIARFLSVITIAAIVALSRWKLIFGNGIIGHNWDWNIPLLKASSLHSFEAGSFLWSTRGLGVADMFARYWNWFLFGPGIMLGGEVWSKTLIVLILMVSFCSFYLFSSKFLAYFFGKNNKPEKIFFISIFLSLYYTLNPFVFNDIISGSLPYLMAYSLAPLALYFFILFVNRGSLVNVLCFSLLIFVISGALYPYIFTYFISLIILLLFARDRIRKAFTLYIISFLLVPFLFIFFGYGFLTIEETAYGKHLELENSSYSNQFLNTKQTILTSFTNEGFLNRNMFTYSLSTFGKICFYFSTFLILVLFVYKFFRKKGKGNKLIIVSLLLFLISISIVSISKSPLTGKIFLWLMDNFIPFRAIRTTYHLMFINIFVFLFFAAMALVKFNKRLLGILFILLITSFVPIYLQGDNGLKILKSLEKDSLDQYTLNEDLIYYLQYQFKRKNDDRMLYIPPTSSPLYLETELQRRGQGGDPDINKISRSFIHGDGVFDDYIEKDIVSGNLNRNLLSLLGIRNFLIRKDVEQVFSRFKNDYNYEEIEKIFTSEIDYNSKYIVYGEINNVFFPKIFSSKNIIVTKRNFSDFIYKLERLNDKDIEGSIFYLESQNEKERNLLESFEKIEFSNPIIEFKKINPTKYRIRFHGAKKDFPLLFSESFHDEWRIYSSKLSSYQVEDDLESYKIFDDNEYDQATKEELTKFIKEGWVTDLGDGSEREIRHKNWNAKKQKEELDYIEKYSIDFVSKNFQNTIQNDNLSNGHFWETWFQQPIRNNENHLIANGFANSWIINPEEVCQKNDTCIKNADGSYDFEIVVEFWPQRLFYLGLTISGLTLLGCLIYISYEWRKNRDKISKKDEK